MIQRPLNGEVILGHTVICLTMLRTCSPVYDAAFIDFCFSGIVSYTCVAVMALIGIIPEVHILKDVRQQWYCFKAGKLPNHGNLDNIALAIRLFVFSAYTVLGIM